MTTTLFTYGTLEITDVIEAVTGRSFAAMPAVLEDHARFLLHGETYPGMIHEAGAEVAGVLYEGIDDHSLGLLDLFEGGFYRRETVRVTTHEGARKAAFTYLVPPEHRALLSDRRWDRDAFAARHLSDFLAGCKDFHATHRGRSDAARNAG